MSELDKTTLQKLLKEAEASHKKSKKAWLKYDSSDDMHDMEHWSATVEWLKEKLNV